MLIPRDYRTEATERLFHSVKKILLCAPLFATFSLNCREGVLTVLIKGSHKSLEERQLIQCFDPEELEDDFDDEIIKDIQRGLFEFLEKFYPTFDYEFTELVEPSAKDLLKIKSLSILEKVKAKKVYTRKLRLRRFFLKRDFFLAEDVNDPSFTCGFLCDISAIDLLEKYFRGEIPGDDLPSYLKYVPNPKAEKDE